MNNVDTNHHGAAEKEVGTLNETSTTFYCINPPSAIHIGTFLVIETVRSRCIRSPICRLFFILRPVTSSAYAFSLRRRAIGILSDVVRYGIPSPLLRCYDLY